MIYNLPHKNNTFIYDKIKGKTGERAVLNYYNQKGSSVIDVSENSSFQKIDIDLIIDDEFYEVKTQGSINKSNKITLEIETQYSDDLYIEGWFLTTEANILVFYDKYNNIAYNIKTSELRKLYNEFENDFETYYYDEDYKISKLAYVDIDFLKKHSKTLEILNYNFLTA